MARVVMQCKLSQRHAPDLQSSKRKASGVGYDRRKSNARWHNFGSPCTTKEPVYARIAVVTALLGRPVPAAQ